MYMCMIHFTFSVDILLIKSLSFSLPTPQPAPASETVDHTIPEFMNPCQDAADESSVTLLTPEPEPQGIPSCSLSALPSRLSTESPSSSDSETDEGYEQTQTTKARTRGQLWFSSKGTKGCVKLHCCQTTVT